MLNHAINQGAAAVLVRHSYHYGWGEREVVACIRAANRQYVLSVAELRRQRGGKADVYRRKIRISLGDVGAGLPVVRGAIDHAVDQNFDLGHHHIVEGRSAHGSDSAERCPRHGLIQGLDVCRDVGCGNSLVQLIYDRAGCPIVAGDQLEVGFLHEARSDGPIGKSREVVG